MFLQYLLAIGGKRINLDHFPKLRRGHTARGKCCDGKDHSGSRFEAAQDWAEERGLKLIEFHGEVVAIAI